MGIVGEKSAISLIKILGVIFLFISSLSVQAAKNPSAEKIESEKFMDAIYDLVASQENIDLSLSEKADAKLAGLEKIKGFSFIESFFESLITVAIELEKLEDHDTIDPKNTNLVKTLEKSNLPSDDPLLITLNEYSMEREVVYKGLEASIKIISAKNNKKEFKDKPFQDGLKSYLLDRISALKKSVENNLVMSELVKVEMDKVVKRNTVLIGGQAYQIMVQWVKDTQETLEESLKLIEELEEKTKKRIDYLPLAQEHFAKAIDVDIDALKWLPSAKDDTYLFMDLPAISEILKSKEEKFKDEFIDGLKGLEKELKDSIIEQDETIERLMEIERRNLLYDREKPEHLMMMGLPGGGKDTTVEEYTRVINGNSKDWEKNLFRLPIMRKNPDLWQVLGSATGYVGSQNFPPFLDFLVKCSGGKYYTERSREGTSIHLNESWSEGQVLSGYSSPKDCVVFVNEFHNWSKEIKDSFLKEFLEKGIAKINNPNGGLGDIQVPVTILMASNDGIGLISSRNADGTRNGRALTYDEMLGKWESVYQDKDRLREEVRRSGRGALAPEGETAPGTSEEMANRIQNVVLQKPISPDGLQKVAEIKLNKLKKQLEKITDNFGAINLEWSEYVPVFLQEYRYIAEENARPIEERIKQLVEATIFKLIQEEKIHPSKKEEGQDIYIDVKANEDGTYSLVIEGSDFKEVERLMDGTLATQDREPLSDDEIEHLLSLKERLSKKVFGIDLITRDLARAVINNKENSRLNKNDPDVKLTPAKTMAFFGLSSTGKTETAKVLAEEITGSRENLVTIDFSTIQTTQQLEEMILGNKADPRKTPSKFMKEYDRLNGNVVFVFDELANAPKDVLKGLYDILREPIVTTFNDGRERVMSGVNIIITGNAGEEWFQGIPEQVPALERQLSMYSIYKKMARNERAQRVLLENYFSEALINRIGMQNIFFFPPLDFKAIRELVQLKLSMALKAMEPQKGRHGVYLQFASADHYHKMVEAIEEHGFYLDEQGASIDRAANVILVEYVKEALRANKVPNGSEVRIEVGESKKVEGEGYGYTVYLTPEGQDEPIEVFLRGKKKEKRAEFNAVDQMFTAYHEAGHELVRHVFMNEYFESEGISIIPGVELISNRWVYYAGIARSEETKDLGYNRARVLREMAVLHGGWVGESIVAKGQVSSAGKSNDMERATMLAQKAVANLGLSDFGYRSIQPEEPLSEYLKSMTPEMRKAFHAEVDKLMKESEHLARIAIATNFENAFIPMGKKLAEMGDMKEEDMKEFYKNHSVIKESDTEAVEYAQKYKKGELLVKYGIQPNPEAEKGFFARMWDKVTGNQAREDQPKSGFYIGEDIESTYLQAELVDEELMSHKVAEIHEIALEEKRKQIEAVETPEFPLWEGASTYEAVDKALNELGLGKTDTSAESAKGVGYECERALR